MSTLKSKLVKFGEKMLLNEKGEVSFAKLGGNIIAVAGVVLSMPTMGIDVSDVVLNVTKVVMAVGGALGWNGMRDALTKSK